MVRNMILNRGVSASLIAWRTWGGQHEDRLKAEVIEIGLEKRSARVFEVQGVAMALHSYLARRAERGEAGPPGRLARRASVVR